MSTDLKSMDIKALRAEAKRIGVAYGPRTSPERLRDDITARREAARVGAPEVTTSPRAKKAPAKKAAAKKAATPEVTASTPTPEPVEVPTGVAESATPVEVPTEATGRPCISAREHSCTGRGTHGRADLPVQVRHLAAICETLATSARGAYRFVAL